MALSGYLGWAAAPPFMAGIASFAGWRGAAFAAAAVAVSGTGTPLRPKSGARRHGGSPRYPSHSGRPRRGFHVRISLVEARVDVLRFLPDRDDGVWRAAEFLPNGARAALRYFPSDCGLSPLGLSGGGRRWNLRWRISGGAARRSGPHYRCSAARRGVRRTAARDRYPSILDRGRVDGAHGFRHRGRWTVTRSARAPRGHTRLSARDPSARIYGVVYSGLDVGLAAARSRSGR